MSHPAKWYKYPTGTKVRRYHLTVGWLSGTVIWWDKKAGQLDIDWDLRSQERLAALPEKKRAAESRLPIQAVEKVDVQ